MASRDNVKIDRENRIVVLSDDIDKNTAGVIQSFMLEISAFDDSEDELKKDYKREPIKLYINSNGGSIQDTWAMIDIVESINTPVYTYCTGYALSGGFLLFLAGEKRYGSKHAMWMYHQIYCRLGDYVEGLSQSMDLLHENQRQIEEYVMQKTKITEDILSDVYIKKEDWYLRIDDAIKYGVVTDLI